MLRVVFVCTGNICRSPAAHAAFEAWLAREGVTGVSVDSAGMGGWHTGELPDARARKEGARRGYALTHKARVVTTADFANTVLIAMDNGHADGLARRTPPGFDPTAIVLFRAFEDLDADGQPARTAPDVDDPYYGDERDFAAMFDTIERGLPGLIQWVRGRVSRGR